MKVELPIPDADESAHSDALAALIRDEIAAHGPIPFSRYMELCLYAPGLGYYSAGKTKFGAAGDFVTAPELGDLFARCIAGRWRLRCASSATRRHARARRRQRTFCGRGDA